MGRIRDPQLRRIEHYADIDTIDEEEIRLGDIFFMVAMIGLLAGGAAGTPLERAREADRLAEAMLDRRLARPARAGPGTP